MKNNELNILVCGSQRFDDEPFVSGILDELFANCDGKIDNLIVSRFSGACKFAQEWAVYKNENEGGHIGIKEFAFDMKLEPKNTSLYEQLEIPDIILRNDDFFQKGCETLRDSGAKIVVAFPNLEGNLGAATLNIQRFANLAEIPVFDCSDALRLIHQHRMSMNAEETMMVPAETVGEKMGLENNNPRRKM